MGHFHSVARQRIGGLARTLRSPLSTVVRQLWPAPSATVASVGAIAPGGAGDRPASLEQCGVASRRGLRTPLFGNSRPSVPHVGIIAVSELSVALSENTGGETRTGDLDVLHVMEPSVVVSKLVKENHRRRSGYVARTYQEWWCG